MIRRVAVARALVVVALVGGCGAPDDDRPLPPAPPVVTAAPAAAPSPDPVSVTDVVYLQQMISHHDAALAMARRAVAVSPTPAVRALAAAVVAEDEPELRLMRRWLAAVGIEPVLGAGGGHAHGGMTDADVAALGVLTGAAFDAAFRDLMTDHSLGAVAVSRDEATLGENRTLRELAAGIATRASDRVLELQQMR